MTHSSVAKSGHNYAKMETHSCTLAFSGRHMPNSFLPSSGSRRVMDKVQ